MSAIRYEPFVFARGIPRSLPDPEDVAICLSTQGIDRVLCTRAIRPGTPVGAYGKFIDPLFPWMVEVAIRAQARGVRPRFALPIRYDVDAQPVWDPSTGFRSAWFLRVGAKVWQAKRDELERLGLHLELAQWVARDFWEAAIATQRPAVLYTSATPTGPGVLPVTGACIDLREHDYLRWAADRTLRHLRRWEALLGGVAGVYAHVGMKQFWAVPVVDTYASGWRWRSDDERHPGTFVNGPMLDATHYYDGRIAYDALNELLSLLVASGADVYVRSLNPADVSLRAGEWISEPVRPYLAHYDRLVPAPGAS